MAFFSGVLITGNFVLSPALGRPAWPAAFAREGIQPRAWLAGGQSWVAKTKTKTKTKIQDKATGWAAVY